MRLRIKFTEKICIAFLTVISVFVLSYSVQSHIREAEQEEKIDHVELKHDSNQGKTITESHHFSGIHKVSRR